MFKWQTQLLMFCDAVRALVESATLCPTRSVPANKAVGASCKPVWWKKVFPLQQNTNFNRLKNHVVLAQKLLIRKCFFLNYLVWSKFIFGFPICAILRSMETQPMTTTDWRRCAKPLEILRPNTSLRFIKVPVFPASSSMTLKTKCSKAAYQTGKYCKTEWIIH